MEDKNITAVRHRSKQRQRREHDFFVKLFVFVFDQRHEGDEEEDPWENPSVDI
jgi:hypothetical protein